jgi:hypothetical protein
MDAAICRPVSATEAGIDIAGVPIAAVALTPVKVTVAGIIEPPPVAVSVPAEAVIDTPVSTTERGATGVSTPTEDEA